jgi:hypothetical protein
MRTVGEDECDEFGMQQHCREGSVVLHPRDEGPASAEGMDGRWPAHAQGVGPVQP